MGSLIGVELPTAVNFVIAFVVVLILIGAAAWLVRRFGATSIDAAARGRQPRLAVIDSANVDGRRKLVVIRRDNVEHLLMIGGPTDVVVETNIVRSGVARDPVPARNGENGHAAAWQAPEPAPVPAPMHPPRAERPHQPRMAEEPQHWQPQPEPPQMPMPMAPPPLRAVRPADTLAGLAAEIGRPMPEPPPRHHVHVDPQPAPQPVANAPQPVLHPDQSLAEMAQRLEAALRRPAPAKVVAGDGKGGAPRAAAAPKAAAAAAAPAAASAQPNNLEKEMANLLGRPGKT